MKVGKAKELEARPVSEPGAASVSIRVLMGKAEGAPNFVMRQFDIAPGGTTPYHTHDWEHEVFVVSGRGKVRGKGGDSAIEAGSFVYVAPNEEHAFTCSGDSGMSFLCVVPAGKYPGQ
jgi:quercetin dioxygenase-like cupin family protein